MAVAAVKGWFMRRYFTQEHVSFTPERWERDAYGSIVRPLREVTEMPLRDQCISWSYEDLLADIDTQEGASGVVEEGSVEPPSDVSTVRVVSLNLEMCRKLDEILEQLSALRPDVVLMQEVDICTPRTRRLNHVGIIARHLRMNAVFVCEVADPCSKFAPGDVDMMGGAMGNAILSRFPVADAAAVRLPCLREPARVRERHEDYKHHNAAVASISVPFAEATVNWMVASVHLDPHHTTQEARARQLQVVTAHISDMPQHGGCSACVIAGDMNTVGGGYIWSSVKEAEYFAGTVVPEMRVTLRNERGATERRWSHALPPDRPTLWALLGVVQMKLDWILFTNSVRVVTADVGDAAGQECSDHMWVMAELAPYEPIQTFVERAQ